MLFLKDKADAHARALVDLKLMKTGDGVAIWMPDSVEKVISNLINNEILNNENYYIYSMLLY